MILIKELFPNPSGSDEDGEWIRIINLGTEEEDASVLKVVDESGKSFSLASVGTLAPGETVELGRSATGIALNNNGDTVFLHNASNEIIDQLSYNSAKEGEIVVAPAFALEARQAGEPQTLEATEFGTIEYTAGTAPVLVGITVALVAAVLTWFVAKKLFEDENEELYK